MPFVVALAISVLATPIAGRLGRALGLVDRPADALKIHRAPVSILGGVAAAGAAFAAAAALGHPPSGWVLGAGALALALGLADDVRALPASARAAGQAAAGMLLVAGGLRLEPLGVLGGAAMVFAAVACANAVNMLDGQDGLAGGLAAIAALGLAGVAGPGTGGGPELGLALSGGLIGFLVWNRPPARVFLGNGGAYAVGVLLAALTAGPAGTGWPGLLAAAACMGVFAVEFTLTVARRLVSRIPLATGDRLHSYDVLADLLRSRGAVTVAFWALGGTGVALSLAVRSATLPVGIAVTALVGAAALGGGLFLWSRAPRPLRGAAWGD